MSLISQNALLKTKPINVDEESTNGSVPADDEHTVFDEKPEPVVNLKKKKRSRGGSKQPSKENSSTKIQQEKKDMKSLESLLFGTLYNPIHFGNEANNNELFIVDKSAGNELAVYEETKDGEAVIEQQRKPVWIDEEEDTTQVDILRVKRLRKLRKEPREQPISGAEYVSRLRAQHAKLNPGTEWAQLDKKESNESDDDNDGGVDDILRSNNELVVKSRVKLLPGLLEYSRFVDGNAEEPSNAPINSVQFHGNGQLLLTAGMDKRVRFFQVDGKHNAKVQSVYLEDCPVYKASFLPDGSQVIVSGRRKFFYSFDLVKAEVDKIGPLTGREENSLEVFEVSPDSKTVAFVGNEGYILLVSPRTKELIGTLKMNGTARSLAFVDGGQQLMSSGGDGHIYHWDLRTRKCIHKAVDEGCINGSALCASPDSSLFAAGSSEGVVNIYRREEFLGGKRKPLKTVANLTTKVDFMKFNHDAQILAISSNMKKDSLKLIHIPSFNVFSNWPAPRCNLQYPRCLDFSPGGGFMALGNAAGKVLLYKLHHYQKA